MAGGSPGSNIELEEEDGDEEEDMAMEDYLGSTEPGHE
jgi:hypothetical protein